jgi:hypothetical protein
LKSRCQVFVRCQVSGNPLNDMAGFAFPETLGPVAPDTYNFTCRSLSEFVITDTELRLIAAAAKIGLSSSPKTG